MLCSRDHDDEEKSVSNLKANTFLCKAVKRGAEGKEMKPQIEAHIIRALISDRPY